MAKGIAYAASVPLISVNTTLSMFYGFLDLYGSQYNISGSDLLCPVIDARRMEVYYSVFETNGEVFKQTKAEIINPSSFDDLPSESRVFIFGNPLLSVVT